MLSTPWLAALVIKAIFHKNYLINCMKKDFNYSATVSQDKSFN
ncbi:hypothetical protein [Piscirickettsia salmonis]|nr:hypothetical protein [Piscirickettsia salmonis]